MSYHNIWCVYVIMVPSLATTRAILLILLSVFLLFLLLLFHTTAITLCISKRLALKNWTYKAYMKSKNYKFKHQTVLNPFSTNIKHTFLMPNIVNNSSRFLHPATAPTHQVGFWGWMCTVCAECPAFPDYRKPCRSFRWSASLG